MAGIADRLRAHVKIDRFGVKLIRNPLGLSERDLLLETCTSQTGLCAALSSRVTRLPRT